MIKVVKTITKAVLLLGIGMGAGIQIQKNIEPAAVSQDEISNEIQQTTKLNDAKEPVKTLELEPYPMPLLYTSSIVTHYGTFARADEQTIFDESYIAREFEQIRDETKQLIIPNVGIFKK